MIVEGICVPKFHELKKIFQEYFDSGIENGANFSIVRNNDILVNIYGGLKNKIEPWDKNTIANTFSLSKGIYASCVQSLSNKKKLILTKLFLFIGQNSRKTRRY